MTRRRWVYFGAEAVEVSLDYAPEPANSDHVLWNDRSYQDMGDGRFASRAAHREYMRRNGLTTADDFTQEWAKAARDRADVRAGVDRHRKQDIVQAIEKLNAGYKPRVKRYAG